jgi:hypothetical protein
MKKNALIICSIVFLFACEKSPLLKEYDSFSGDWNSINATDETLKNAIISWGSCRFTNKNLKNGNHACTGKIQFKEGYLNILYKIIDDNQIIFQSVSTSVGSTDPTATKLPIDLFKGTWEYFISNGKMTLKKNISSNQTFLNYTIQLTKNL